MTEYTRPIYAPQVPTLEYTCGMTVLRSLLYKLEIFQEYTIPPHSDRDLNNVCWFKKQYAEPLRKHILLLPLPEPIKQNLYKMIWKITMELRMWLYTPLYTNCIESLRRPTNFHHLNELVIRSDGLIDELQTVRNILRNPRLSKEQKLTLACRYCLEDEIQKIIHETRNDIKYTTLWAKLDVSYWVCYKYNNMNFTNGITAFYQHVPFILITYGKLTNQYAKKYFWDQLELQQKKACIEQFVNRNIKPQWFMIYDLPEEDRINFFKRLSVRFGKNITKLTKYKEYLVAMWSAIQSTTSTISLYHIYMTIIASPILCEDSIIVIKEIWQITSNEMKSYFTKSNKVLLGRILLRENKYELFIEMLKDIPKNFKNEIIFSTEGLEFCALLRDIGLSEELQIFMESCLSEQDFSQFLTLLNDKRRKRHRNNLLRSCCSLLLCFSENVTCCCYC